LHLFESVFVPLRPAYNTKSGGDLLASKQGGNLTQTDKRTQNSQNTTTPTVQSTPTATVPSATPVNKPTTQNNQSDGSYSLFDANHINSFSTAVIAAFAALTFFIVWRQDRDRKLSERAWILPDIGGLEGTKASDVFQVKCKIRNTGRTPAWITSMGACAYFVKDEKDLPKTPNYTRAGPFAGKGTLLSPDAFTETGVPVTQQQAEQVRRGEMTLYFSGFVQYRDIFGEKHETRYCYQLKPSHDLTGAPSEFYVGGPDRYNVAD
jgi:hypothetical protein